MILITGATGFVGSALTKKLADSGSNVRAAVRRTADELPSGISRIQSGDLLPDTDWHDALSGVNVVVHLAARVHVMRDTALDPLAEFRLVNVLGTLNLARQAALAGVRRFIFISSIKVNGEATDSGSPFRASSEPAPRDPYGVSKFEAELALREVAAQTGMEIVIIRPPLVYGPGVKANFESMMRWLQRGIPLPLGAIENQRSLVALDNLLDLIGTCINHPAASNQTFLVSDGEDLSTSELLKRMGDALGRPTRLISVPPALLKMGAVLVGRPQVVERLCGSLQVDITKTRELLGWVPPISVDEGLRETAARFLSKIHV